MIYVYICINEFLKQYTYIQLYFANSEFSFYFILILSKQIYVTKEIILPYIVQHDYI